MINDDESLQQENARSFWIGRPPHYDAILIFDGSLPISELRRRKLPPEFVL